METIILIQSGPNHDTAFLFQIKFDFGRLAGLRDIHV